MGVWSLLGVKGSASGNLCQRDFLLDDSRMFEASAKALCRSLSRQGPLSNIGRKIRGILHPCVAEFHQA